MTKLVITVTTVPIEEDGPDPRLIDPHDIAISMIEEHNEACQACGEPESRVTFVSAEWES